MDCPVASQSLPLGLWSRLEWPSSNVDLTQAESTRPHPTLLLCQFVTGRYESGQTSPLYPISASLKENCTDKQSHLYLSNHVGPSTASAECQGTSLARAGNDETHRAH